MVDNDNESNLENIEARETESFEIVDFKSCSH